MKNLYCILSILLFTSVATFAQTSVSLDTTISTTLQTGDTETYQIQANQGGVLVIDLTSIPDVGFYGMHVVFDILAADGVTVIGQYRHADNPYWPNNASLPVVIPAGTYNIKLFLQGNGSTTPFNFTAHLDTTDAYEYNNDFSLADDVTVPLSTSFQAKIYGYNNTTIDENNTAGTDIDYYKVYIPESGVLTCNFTNIPLSGFYGLPLEFYIYESDQTTLVSHYYHGDNPYFPVSISYPTTIQEPGSYYIRVTCGVNGVISNKQHASAYDVIFNLEPTLNTVHISDNSTNLFKVYPNPSSDIINLKLSNQVADKIMVTDLSGKSILTQTVNTTQINVENLSPGVYMISAYYRSTLYQTKFIKE